MNFDFTPPQPDFKSPQNEAAGTPSEAANESPNEASLDWIAAALPPQVQTLPAPQPMPYSPIPAPGAPPQQQGDGTGGLIPYKNPTALIGYYVSVFGLIPCAGLLLGPTAIFLGIMGLKFAKANPHTKGVAHAWVAIVLGSIELLAHIAIIGAGITGITS